MGCAYGSSRGRRVGKDSAQDREGRGEGRRKAETAASESEIRAGQQGRKTLEGRSTEERERNGQRPSESAGKRGRRRRNELLPRSRGEGVPGGRGGGKLVTSLRSEPASLVDRRCRVRAVLRYGSETGYRMVDGDGYVWRKGCNCRCRESKARLWILGVPGSSLKESGIENVTDGKSVFSLSGGNVDIGILRRPIELDGRWTYGNNGMTYAPEMLSQAWRVKCTSPIGHSGIPDQVVDAAQLTVEGTSQDDASAVCATEVDGALPSGVPRHATFEATACWRRVQALGCAD
jgi:hypothetical protein